MKKQTILASAAAVTVMGVAGLTGLQTVSAQTTAGTTDGPTSLIQKIAKKFNLKEADVKAVFDQEHTERKAEMTKQVEDNLTQAVKDGKITEAQKQAILTKRSELQAKFEANRDSMKDKTEDERKAAMEAEKADLEAWAKTNNISTDFLRYVMGRGGMGHGHGGPGGPGGRQG